jgi:hypothetical protein
MTITELTASLDTSSLLSGEGTVKTESLDSELGDDDDWAFIGVVYTEDQVDITVEPTPKPEPDMDKTPQTEKGLAGSYVQIAEEICEVARVSSGTGDWRLTQPYVRRPSEKFPDIAEKAVVVDWPQLFRN